MAVIDSFETGEFLFGFETCQKSGVTPGSMLVIFDLDVDFDGYRDYTVALVRTDDGEYRIRVFESSSSDPSQWTLVYEDRAAQEYQSDRSNWLAVGAVPRWVLEYTDEFAFLVTAFESEGDRTDLLPEADEGLIAFPYNCTYAELQSAEVTVEPAATERVAAALRQRGFTVVAVAPVVGSMVVHDVGDGGLSALEDTAGVRSVERPQPLTAAALPNDPEPTAWALEQINAEDGWTARSAASVDVAVLDDGVDPGRSDLTNRVGPGFDAVLSTAIGAGENSTRGYHGTSVAGIIAAIRDNATQVAGINDGAVIHPYRVFDAASCALPGYLAAALDHLIQSGTARVVNISLGSASSSAAVEAAVDRAAEAGLILVAAGGNEGAAQLSYPAAYPEVIAVGATTPSGGHASYSNTGEGLHIAAPGGNGSFTRSGDIAVLADYDQLGYQSGTSFAVPYVTAAISLLLGDNPGLSPTEVAARLAATARDAGPPGHDTSFGHGILDLAALLDGTEPPPDSDPDQEPDQDPTPSPDDDEQSADTDPSTVFDGDPTTTERLSSNDVFRAAVALSTQRFPEQAGHVVIARHDTFADALAGAPLTAEGPLLFSFSDRLPGFVLDEINRVLPGGGRVYMLGGEAALTPAVVDQLRSAGHSPRRLHGRDRAETAVAIAREVAELYGNSHTALLARAFAPAGDPTAAWADAIAVSSYAASTKSPVLLTNSDSLHPATARWLANNPQPRRVLLGGEAALSGTLWGQIDGVKARVAGRDRAGTAVRIANDLWGQGFAGERNVAILNGWDHQGWAMGLIGAGAAADADAPLLLTARRAVPQITLDRVTNCDTAAVDMYLLGGSTHISDEAARELETVDGSRC